MNLKRFIVGGVLSIILLVGIYLIIYSLFEYALKNNDLLQTQFAPLENTPIEERIEIEKNFLDFLKNIDGVFRIKNNLDLFGTCFLYKDSIFVTAAHLVEQVYPNLIFINQWEPTNLIKISYTRDIAILELKNKNFRSTNYFKFKSVQSIFKEFKNQKFVPLEKILIGMKCMSNEKPRILIGQIFSWDPLKKSFKYYLVSESSGCSGAPIFSYDGYVIGIHQLKGGILGEGTDIDEIIKALSN